MTLKSGRSCIEIISIFGLGIVCLKPIPAVFHWRRWMRIKVFVPRLCFLQVIQVASLSDETLEVPNEEIHKLEGNNIYCKHKEKEP